jgi:hypothetical protein
MEMFHSMKMKMNQLRTLIRALEIALEESEGEVVVGGEPLLDEETARSLIYRFKRFEQLEIVPF